MNTGETRGKWIYISTDGAYEVRPPYEVRENTVKSIDPGRFLEEIFANSPEIMQIDRLLEAARKNEIAYEYAYEEIARLRQQFVWRHEYDRDWILYSTPSVIKNLIRMQETTNS